MKLHPLLWPSGLGILIVLSIMWQHGCAGNSASQGPDWRKQFLSELGDMHILPLLNALANEAESLSETAEAFCDNTNAGTLQALRDTWQETRKFQKQSEIFSFGPYREYPWRLGPKLDLWPVRPSEIEETLTNQPWAETGDLSLVTGFSKGMPAMEYLLYGTSPQGDSALERFGSNPQACIYLTLLAADIASNARALYDAWSPTGDNYLRELTAAGEGSLVYSEVDLAFGEVINRLGFTAENMRESKVAKPGGFSAPTPDYTLLESHISGRSLQDMEDNLVGIASVYNGDYFNGTGSGVKGLIADNQKSIDDKMQEALESVRIALGSFDGPLKDALDTHPTKLRDLYNVLKELQKTIQVELSQHLAVTIKFNDNDGD